MLTVGSFTNTMESVAFYNTLETLAFGCSYYFNLVAFSENVYGNGVTNIFFLGIVSEFFYEFLGRSIGLSEVIFSGSGGEEEEAA